MNLKGIEGERQYTSEPQNVSELFQAAMTRSTGEYVDLNIH